MKTPSYEYELLHQFEVIFRDGEHKTQDATRDYSKVWENVIDNPPGDGVTPIHVYRMNGTTCAVIAGVDELVDNEECAMEIARLAALLLEAEKILDAMTSSRDANNDALLQVAKEKALLSEEIHALMVCITDTEHARHDLADAAKEYLDAGVAGGTFDGGRVREARARLKELVENPE